MALLTRPGYTNVFDPIFQGLYSSEEQTCYRHFPRLAKILSGQGVLQGRAHLATSVNCMGSKAALSSKPVCSLYPVGIPIGTKTEGMGSL